MDEINKMTALRELTQVPHGKAAVWYEQQERVSSRDCLIFYCDGRVLFERYCYGEAAGLTFSIPIASITEGGRCRYAQPLPIEVKESALPKTIEILPDGRLRINDNYNLWHRVKVLDTDPRNGYGRLKVLFGSRSINRRR